MIGLSTIGSHYYSPGGYIDSGRARNQIREDTVLPAGGTLDLLNVVGHGAITGIFMALGSLSATPTFTLLDSVIRVYLDGAVVPSIQVKVKDFFFSRGIGDARFWLADRLGVSYTDYTVNNGHVGYYRYFYIPYRTAARVVLVNGDGAVAGAVFSEVSYIENASGHDPRMARFSASYNDAQAVAPAAWLTLANIAGRGIVESVYLSVYDDHATTWPEGNVEFYVDGEVLPSFSSSGTEDFFKTSWATACGRYTTLEHGMPVKENNFTSYYRYFFREPVTFDTSLLVRWQHGGAGFNVDVSSLVFYYLSS